MKVSTMLFSLLLASQALPLTVQSVAAQTLDDIMAQNDDHNDAMQLKFGYHRAAMKLAMNAPAYSYDEVTESIRTLRDGNQVKTSKTNSYVRDQAGHMRIATTSLRGAERIVFADPATQTAYMVRPDRKDVLRMTGQALADAPRSTTTPTASVLDYSKTTVRTELGVKEVAGVQAIGTSTVRTIPAGAEGNEKDMVDTSEYWFSRDLGDLVYRHTVSARYGETTVRVENLKLGNAPAATFAVPEGYQVHDVAPATDVAQQ